MVGSNRWWLVMIAATGLACSTAGAGGSDGGSSGQGMDDGVDDGDGDGTVADDGTTGDPPPDTGDGTGAPATDDGTDTDPDGTGDATADTGTDTGPTGALDCEALCDPYETCDEGVFLSCQANCTEIVPPLEAFDDACGAAAAAFFECRYSLSCEDVIDAQAGNLDPDPCVDLLNPYIDTCLAVVPRRCDAYCNAYLTCAELQDDPETVAGCQFECLLYEGYAALADVPACYDATDALFQCIEGAACVDMEVVGCETESEEYVNACGV